MVETEGVEPGLCKHCRHSRVVRSDRGGVFYRCLLADGDPRFPKYPRLPVRECAGYEKAEEPHASPGSS
jgi:hypothetical protein